MFWFFCDLILTSVDALAFSVTILLAMYCDRKNRRALVSSILMMIGAAGFLTLYCLPVDSHVGRYCALVVSAVGSFATFPILLGWLSSNLRTTSAQGFALGLNVAIGSPAQILGVWIYPNSHAANGYRMGHAVNCAFLLVAMCMTLLLAGLYTIRNRHIATGASPGPMWAL